MATTECGCEACERDNGFPWEKYGPTHKAHHAEIAALKAEVVKANHRFMNYAREAGKVIRINRVRENLSRWTYDIPSVRELVLRYVKDGKGWADPFAANARLAQYTNDLNPHARSKYHMEAGDFMRDVCPSGLNGVLFDPPYSKRQISECYSGIGLHAGSDDTNELFYIRVLEHVVRKIRPGGWLITMGYSTRGVNGWEDTEVLDVCGWNSGSYDILVLVQRKPNIPELETYHGRSP